MRDPYRVIVVEDDLDVAGYTQKVLELKLGCVVRSYADPTRVRQAIAEFKPDVVITDIQMPGMSGLDLIEQVRAEQPGTPIILMTAHPSIDYVLTALRNQANEFLTKPISSRDLCAHVNRLAKDARATRDRSPKNSVVLAIGAHPDDVEVGVGGILAAHREAGNPVTILTLSRGARDGGVKTAWTEGSASARIIGARLLMEDVAELELRPEFASEAIAKAITETMPTIIYTHSVHDRHQDHRTAHEATLAAADEVGTVLGFQGSTATVDFTPNRFVSIDDFAQAKLAMLDCFAKSQTRPRVLNPDLVLATASYWSRFGDGSYCEPLEVVREVVGAN
ncbi:MAG: response regulator [Terrimesophilobacter sp.]